MFNENELLEAVDILVEEYGFDEDEAIDMIVSEAYNGDTNDLFVLREDYGIFEDEYGDLFIENEMIDYVMDEFDLYEEDAIDLIMECYEEELYNLEESSKRNLAIGAGALAAVGGGLAYKAYRDSGLRVKNKRKKAEKAMRKVKREEDIRRTMDEVEKTRRRSDYRTVYMSDGNGGTTPITVRNDPRAEAKALLKDREKADNRVLKAKKRANKKINRYNRAVDHYNSVQLRKNRR